MQNCSAVGNRLVSCKICIREVAKQHLRKKVRWSASCDYQERWTEGKRQPEREDGEGLRTNLSPCQSPIPSANTPARELSRSTRRMQKSGMVNLAERRSRERKHR